MSARRHPSVRARARRRPVRVGAARAPPPGNPPGLAASRSTCGTGTKRTPWVPDVREPRFSWQIRADTRNVRQQAWQIRVARTDADLQRGRSLAWDSGRVTSNESIHRVYTGAPLTSAHRYAWQVQVWDDKGRASGWSAPASWEMGLLAPSDWRAQSIEPGLQEDTRPRRRRRCCAGHSGWRNRSDWRGVRHLPWALRHAPERQARSEDLLTPGWTSYNKRLGARRTM